jgi:truncated hemoglobin YjbI
VTNLPRLIDHLGAEERPAPQLSLDPVPARGSEPTLYEWAGGLPVLTRMNRLLYEKHVPADLLLAPLFVGTPPGQAQRLASWLAGAIGGPAAGGQDGDFRQAVGFTMAFTEEQWARWVALLATAADEAGLPADAGWHIPQSRRAIRYSTNVEEGAGR